MGKPHAVCIPYPAQGHMTPMLKLAKLLHSRGFHITYVSTEYNHNRLLKSRDPSALDGLPDFRFATIPDGLPPSDLDATQDIPALCASTSINCLAPFRDLLSTLNNPPVSCIVSDGCMSFTLDAARELGVPEVLFWTTSACGLMAYLHYKELIKRDIVPFRNKADLSDHNLETPVKEIPGMPNIRLKDFPSFIRTTDPDDLMLKYLIRETQRVSMASAIILNTVDDLERPVLDAMTTVLSPPVYTVGPLGIIAGRLGKPLESMRSNLWKEDPGCIEWLEERAAGSVVYVNFGSITVMSNEQLVEFAWGLADSKADFLWVVRPDLVKGDSAVLPPEFHMAVGERGFLTSWCPQEEVLSHPAIGGFLTHSGWNSTLESLSAGVPMLCWPFFAEQQTNCRYTCNEWGVGMEINSHVKREMVEGLIRELMGDGEKGKEMRRRAVDWKEKTAEAARVGGSSVGNLDKLIDQVLLGSQQKKNSY